MTTLKAGDRIRHAPHVMQKARDYWQSQGRQPAKGRAEDAYRAKLAERGTVTKVYQNDYAKCIDVTWDSGALVQSLIGQVISADSLLFNE